MPSSLDLGWVFVFFVVTHLCARFQTGGFQVYLHHYTFLFVVFVFEVLSIFFFSNEKPNETVFLGKDNGSNATVHGSSYHTTNTCCKRVARIRLKPNLNSTFPKSLTPSFKESQFG